MKPLFNPGQIVATPGAIEALTRANITFEDLLFRHLSGDWGHVDIEDARTNDSAVNLGLRILSAYKLPNSEEVWVITEWDRSVTTFLLPEDY